MLALILYYVLKPIIILDVGETKGNEMVSSIMWGMLAFSLFVSTLPQWIPIGLVTATVIGVTYAIESQIE